jgi:ABC-2 type transport system permease protein
MKRNKFSQIIASILVNSLYAMENYPVTLLNSLLAPISIIIVIAFVSKGSLTGVAIEGGLLTAMIGAGTSLQMDISHFKNDFKIQDMVISSPTSQFTYMVGMALSEIVDSLPALVVLIALALIFIKPNIVQAATILFVMAMMFIFSSALGFLFSTFTTDIIESRAYVGIFSLVLTTITPIYYPITYIPMPFQYIVYLSPTTYAAEIVQSSMGYLQISQLNLLIDFIVVIGAAFGLLLISYRHAVCREN